MAQNHSYNFALRTDCETCNETNLIAAHEGQHAAREFLRTNHPCCQDCGILMGGPHPEYMTPRCYNCDSRRRLYFKLKQRAAKYTMDNSEEQRALQSQGRGVLRHSDGNHGARQGNSKRSVQDLLAAVGAAGILKRAREQRHIEHDQE